jgi:2-polyprenyl-3-methyl-5-hydroxy-6-metoxy-1,4-benzoquinol methylase
MIKSKFNEIVPEKKYPINHDSKGQIMTVNPFKPLDKVYAGNIFERMQGLEILFSDCKGASVLDLGFAEGLISYELAKNGAEIVHGFEIDQRRVEFANTLFQEVPVQFEFRDANMAVDFRDFEITFSNILLPRYDIVLYLGVYHHLIKQTTVKSVHEFIEALLEKTGRYFAVRTNKINEFEHIILERGFDSVFEKQATATVGQIKIFKRRSI